MKKFLIALAICFGIGTFYAPVTEAEDVWAMTAGNGDLAYVMTETIYNDGNNFGCQAKLYYTRTGKWHIENFYFGQDKNSNWYCYRDNHLTSLSGVELAIFNTARKYR